MSGDTFEALMRLLLLFFVSFLVAMAIAGVMGW